MTSLELVGTADGPMLYIDAFDKAVPTFKTTKKNCLTFHVPLEYRGDYKPKDLPGYDPSYKYRVDAYGKVLCNGITKTSGVRCSKRAMHRTEYCEFHGSALHPFDKIKRDEKPEDELTRYEQFKRGIITVDDLEDDELAACAFRSKDGRLYAPKNMPREILQEFSKALYKRADIEMKKHTVDSVKAVAEIMQSTAVEPEVRLKAAQFLIERNLGKTPQVIAFQTTAPWEEIFDDIAHERPRAIEKEPILDVEVVSDEGEDGAVHATADSERDRSTESGEPVYTGGDERDLLVGRNGIPYVPPPDNKISVKDSARSRNPAILAQETVVPEFTYDLNDHATQVKKERRKRYIARALGQANVDQPHIALIRIVEQRFTGNIVKWVEPRNSNHPK